MQLQPGTYLQGDKYRIISTLGSGGFGITYLAEQTMTERKVCIKEFFPKSLLAREDDSRSVRALSNELANDSVRFKAKFIKEAKTIASLKHPSIVQVFDAFEENGTAYYVMDYIEGESLSSIIKRYGALNEATAVHYIRQVADALNHIHERKIMHLDIKPGNVMLRSKDNSVILIDFGLSKHYDAQSGEATSTTPVGVSHGFAPLEQYRQGGVKEFSPETDIYSLGATLYYLVTGTVPPEAADVADEGLPSLPTHLSNETRLTIERAMADRRKQRPHSIGEFLAILPNADVSNRCVSVSEHTDFMPTMDEATEMPFSIHNNTPYESVDLGLSVKWATCNVGAKAPEESGDYFAWGEIRTKHQFSASNCSSLRVSTRYKVSFMGLKRSTEEVYEGVLSGDISGSKTYDAARANWGDGWRMPTRAEFKELVKMCKWKWVVINDKCGYQVVGPNGNSIFMPAAGYVDKSLNSDGSDGFYWSSTPSEQDSTCAYSLTFYGGLVVGWNKFYYGRSIRPVTDK